MADAAVSKRILTGFGNQKDFVVALFVVGIIVVMLIPLPSFFLDILLALSISLALVILLTSMYVERSLDFSVFPSLLLVITLFRLSLNVATTRLILAEAYAGKVVEAFGNFVTEGNLVVGFIIFIILVVIQFVVITRGSGRIAEVAARFTLDAMPGKQMAIDADLNAGLITEADARRRREEIGREADFYGAMDGASKFVRGDAVAGIIITLVNIIGGFIIGIAMKKMDFAEALNTYTILTIGDGLVSQMPALIISTGAGIIITRAATESNLGSDIVKQTLGRSKALYLASGVLFLFAIVPGLPFLPFLVLSGLAGLAAYRSTVVSRKQEQVQAEEKQEKAAKEEPEKIENYLMVDPMEVEIGYGLIPLVDTSQGGDLLDRITMIRRQLATELGIIVPPIRIRDNIQLKSNEYAIKIKGIDIARSDLHVGAYLAMNPGTVKRAVKGTETSEPAFGLPALWITESQKEEAELAGYTVVELPAVLATHLTEVIKRQSHLILSREHVKKLVDNVKQQHPTIIEELVPTLLTIGEIQKVLQNLLRERVSIRDLVTILETLSDHAKVTKQADILSEYVRNTLSRQISKQYQNAQNEIQVITLDPKTEQMISDAIQHTERGSHLVLPPQIVTRIVSTLQPLINSFLVSNLQPIIVCSPLIRLQFKRLLDTYFPNIVILSYNEIVSGVNIKSKGVVSVHEN